MIKRDIANQVNDTLGLTLKEAEEAVEAILEEIKNNLASGEKVSLTGFGSFHVKNKNTRPGRNPRTGETILIQARKVVTFKASDKLKDAINGIPER